MRDRNLLWYPGMLHGCSRSVLRGGPLSFEQWELIPAITIDQQHMLHRNRRVYRTSKMLLIIRSMWPAGEADNIICGLELLMSLFLSFINSLEEESLVELKNFLDYITGICTFIWRKNWNFVDIEFFVFFTIICTNKLIVLYCFWL